MCIRDRIEDNAQLAVMSKRLATINTNVPVDIDFDEFILGEPDYDALVAIYTKLEFNKFLKKLNIGREGGQSSGAVEGLSLIHI